MTRDPVPPKQLFRFDIRYWFLPSPIVGTRSHWVLEFYGSREYYCLLHCTHNRRAGHETLPAIVAARRGPQGGKYRMAADLRNSR